MRRFILSILIITIIYRVIILLIGINNSLIVVVTIFMIVCIGIYSIFNTYKYYRYQHNNEPITIIMEHHMIADHRVIRIPLEDQVDLAVEDRHNVHNKTIKRTACMAIDKLKISDLKNYTISDAFNDIYKYIENINENNKDKAKEVLNLIENMNVYYSNGKIYEKELIKLVWSRINHPINESRCQLLKDNFIMQLLDCSNGNQILHCTEGRITRILQSLQSCDVEDIVNLKPMWAFKEEIANKIIKYQDKLMKKAPLKYVNIMNKSEDITPSEQKLLKKFNDCLVNNLNKRFTIDYVDNGYLNNNELDDITKVYYDSLYDC